MQSCTVTPPVKPASRQAAAGGRPPAAAAARRLPVAAAWGKRRGDGLPRPGFLPRLGKEASDAQGLDLVDARQQVDIERLINACHELQDKVEHMEAQLQQLEDRGRDRAVALRAILRDDRHVESLLSQDDDQLEAGASEREEPWDSYRNSFTLLLSKGYLRTVETVRNRLMVSEWELGQRPIALQLGVSRFEAYCSEKRIEIDYDVISELYDDPTDLRAITDPFLRMRARSIIAEAESEEKAEAWATCTAEAQRLASQFSEAEFISKIIPDPIEHGVIDALRKMVVPLAKLRGM